MPLFERLIFIGRVNFFRLADRTISPNSFVFAIGTASTVTASTLFFVMFTFHIPSPGTFRVPSRILNAPPPSLGYLEKTNHTSSFTEDGRMGRDRRGQFQKLLLWTPFRINRSPMPLTFAGLDGLLYGARFQVVKTGNRRSSLVVADLLQRYAYRLRSRFVAI